MRGPWHSALAYVLTGARVDLGAQDAPDVAELVRELGRRGLVPDGRRRPLPPGLGLGYAQFAAAEREARRALGATGLVAGRPSGRTPDADERRLMADRPPHWG